MNSEQLARRSSHAKRAGLITCPSSNAQLHKPTVQWIYEWRRHCTGYGLCMWSYDLYRRFKSHLNKPSCAAFKVSIASSHCAVARYAPVHSGFNTQSCWTSLHS